MGMGFSVNVRIGAWANDLRLGLKDALKTLGTLHAESVGLDAFAPEVSPRALGLSGRRDLAHFIRARGLAGAALLADVGGRRLADAQALDVNLSRIREALQLAGDLGMPYLVVPAGFIPPEEEKQSGASTALREAARTLAAWAAQSKVRVCWQAGLEPPEALKQFLAENDSSGVLAIDLNPGGFLARGCDPLKALSLLSERVALVRAVDHFSGGGEAPFGKGDVRWGELLIALSGLPRTAPVDLLTGCTLEGERVPAIGSAIQRLAALRNNPAS